jgi:hypothetical protein
VRRKKEVRRCGKVGGGNRKVNTLLYGHFLGMLNTHGDRVWSDPIFKIMLQVYFGDRNSTR